MNIPEKKVKRTFKTIPKIGDVPVIVVSQYIDEISWYTNPQEIYRLHEKYIKNANRT